VTFVDELQAEIALSMDRPMFIRDQDIMEHIPRQTYRYILCPDPIAYLRGFEDLFTYLNMEPAPYHLRRFIKAYFYNNIPLRGHLSQPSVYRVMCQQGVFTNIPLASARGH
jgi:hypothetical protein